MKYLLISIILALLSFGIGILVEMLVHRKLGKERSKIIRIITPIVVAVILLLLASFAFFSITFESGDASEKALMGNDTVNVEALDGGYFFDGPGDSHALIFYPGGRVECAGYAPLMLKLAEGGIDCFVVEMPLNFAMFGQNRGQKYLDSYDYDYWIAGGHSMGGPCAASFAIENKDQIDGILLLASYSTKKIDDEIKLCSIYGTQDTRLGMDNYNKYKEMWPTNSVERVIEGANHTQFADCSTIGNDSEATISMEEQQRITAETVLETFRNINENSSR